MLTRYQLATMLELQDKMNTKVNPQWLTAGYAYLRAAMIESVEAIDHHGWKWWKAQNLDLSQVQMELVDIWHFALSNIIIKFDGDKEKASLSISKQLQKSSETVQFDNTTYMFTKLSLVENLELMSGLCAAKRFEVPLFMHIITLAAMDSNMLFEQYVGKNILNFFRQDHGYKEGSYIKIWDGREDNEHLVEVLSLSDPESTRYSQEVYDQLKSRYPEN